MIKIQKSERLNLFKVAQDQLEVRIHNSTGGNVDNLIDIVFKKLDIEFLCPTFIKAKKEEANQFINDALSVDVIKRMRAREAVKKNRDIETWTLGDQIGRMSELKKLGKLFKNIKEGRSG